MLKIKSGVTPKNLYIAAAVSNVAQQWGIDVVITAGTDGKHMAGSKHYTGDALDVRCHGIEDKQAFVAAVLARLGKGYQGFIESEMTRMEHFHFEYDPR